MRVVRFMNEDEYKKYLLGFTIRSRKEWASEGRRSTSRGICFFPEYPSPEERLHYLSGVVSFECVVVFETCSDRIAFNQTEGEYRVAVTAPKADIWVPSPVRTKMVREFCREYYNRKILKAVRVGSVALRDKNWTIDWEDVENV